MKYIKLFENFSEEENIAKSFTLEVLPEFWEKLGIKRPAYSGGDEAGMSLLSRDNTITLTLGDDPVPIYRKDVRMYDDKGRKAGRGDDSTFYKIRIYKTHGLGTKEDNILKYSIDAQDDKYASLGGNIDLKPITSGDLNHFLSDEIGSIDYRGFFKIVAVK